MRTIAGGHSRLRSVYYCIRGRRAKPGALVRTEILAREAPHARVSAASQLLGVETLLASQILCRPSSDCSQLSTPRFNFRRIFMQRWSGLQAMPY